MTLQNTIIYLIGFPGVGKYTIARELVNFSGARLVDNHLVNNVVFSLIERTEAKLPSQVWDNIGRIWQVVIDTMADLSAEHTSFVMTNALVNRQSDHDWFAKVQNTADTRKAILVPVILSCAEDEMLQRVASPSRKDRMKMTDPKVLQGWLAKDQPFQIDHAYKLELDVTDLSATDAAEAILRHCLAIKGF